MRLLGSAFVLAAFSFLEPTSVAHARPPGESPLEIGVTPMFTFLAETRDENPENPDGTGDSILAVGGGGELAFRWFGERRHGLHTAVRLRGLADFCILSCDEREDVVTATTSVGWVYRASFGVREGRAWFDVTPRLALEWGVVMADDALAAVGLETALAFDVHTRRGAVFGFGGGVETLITHDGRSMFGGSFWLRFGWSGRR